MIAVIIAGGSGTRLWPLSTPAYPKHLLRLNGDSKSLLQNTYDRALCISSTVYVLTEASHEHHVREQLPRLPAERLIVEPARRGTANCILAALAHLTGKHGESEPIAMLWADHAIRDTEGFKHSFKIAAETSTKEGRIVLIGVEPDHPATGFGYIQKDGLFDERLYVYNVHSFKEKPAYELAQQYASSGNYFWNCGYFVGSISTFKRVMRKHAPDLLKRYKQLCKARSKTEYEQAYLRFKTNAIDYALIEKVDDLLVVPAAFDWLDLGSFSDLHKAVESDEAGNHVHGQQVAVDGVVNSFVQNYLDTPLAVIGLDNVVVVNTPHGILVARKDLAQQVSKVSKNFSGPIQP